MPPPSPAPPVEPQREAPPRPAESAPTRPEAPREPSRGGPVPAPAEIPSARAPRPAPEAPRPVVPATEPPRARAPEEARVQQDRVPRLLASIRTEKGIYKNGERVKILGKVVNIAGDTRVASVVDLRVFRKLKPEERERSPGLRTEKDREVVYRTLLEPQSTEFSDDGYVIQFPSQEVILWLTKQVEFDVGAEVIPRGPGEGSIAATSFAAEEIGNLKLLQVFLMLVGMLFYVLLLIYLVFMKEPTKMAARNMLLVVYGSGLFFLLLALGGPLLISFSPTMEALFRTTPVGLVKATAEKVKDLQWMVNLGGVLGSDNALKGGYGIPLFVLILGMVGGVISMLLKFPEFLHEYDVIEVGGREETRQVSDLRAKLFRYFVYILTGPFLGMVVYSLVTLADYTNTLALSLMAFAVGFIAEQIVQAMLAVARNVLERAKGVFKK